MAETRKGFHEDLDTLTDDVVRLGDMALSLIDDGTDAFLTGDVTEAEKVVEGDKPLDALMMSIEMRACDLLARQNPMATDLRTLVTILRVIHDIERCGDYMVNIAKATRRMYPHTFDPEIREMVDKMRKQAKVQLSTAVQSFAESDMAKAAALEDMDDVMDDLQKDLLRWIFDSHAEADFIQAGVQIALVGRYFERVADHAVNVGERVQFMINGFHP